MLSRAELSDLVVALQVELVGLKSRVTEAEVQSVSLRETILNLTHENELLKRRIYGNKTERTQTTELQLTLGSLLDADKRLQKELDDAVAAARGTGEEGDAQAPSHKPKEKPKGRRDLSVSNLPRFLLEIFDEELEKTGKRIGFEEGHQLMYRRGGFYVLVKRTAKYEVPGRDGPTVLGVETPKTLFRRGLLHSSVVAFILVQKFSLGAHPPSLTPEDVERIHALWVTAVKTLGPNVHHRDIVVAALDSYEAELHSSRDRAVERLRRQIRP